MGTVIRNIATLAFVPVIVAYFGLLFYTQRSGTHADLKRLVATLALPIFATLNTIVVVTRPPTALTRTFSLLWLIVAALGGCRIAVGSRQSIARVGRHHAIVALLLCVAVAARNVVYLVT